MISFNTLTHLDMSDQGPPSPTEPEHPSPSPITPLTTTFDRLSFAADQTPFVYKESTQSMFRAEQPEMKASYEKIAKETSGAYRVGVPVQDFFDEYMPWNEETTAEYKEMKPKRGPVKALHEMARCTVERDIYPLWVSCDFNRVRVGAYILSCSARP